MWVATGRFLFDEDEIKQIAALGKELFTTRARTAFVATDDLTLRMFRVFETYRREDGYETRAFDSEDAALAWLREWEPAATG